ncbi:hypothetical protein L3556_14140 [Candidatus Synechococcus calcipolaris G9]|uniref:Uncharacterized protein n=1 Tax=Candidatus Synechococcus calcipolaris G9 TaxID=1497997 RepID=A0ABT6F2H8_9SYNE|nr:hypothetical protein [Candidatus Synechococcus calcipolaris]MDG2992061.1 hypothetical protein [Candidatus Synechococcus calcipolaris G9]
MSPLEYFLEVTFSDRDEQLWDALTRTLGLVDCETLAQAIALKDFFCQHPDVDGVEAYVQTSESSPYLLLSTFSERTKLAQHQRDRFTEAIEILGDDNRAIEEWLFMETTGDEY